MSFNALMNKTCSIQSKTQTKDEFGQVTSVYADVATNVACRVMPLSAGYGRRDNFESADATHRIYVPLGAYTLDEHNRIVVAGDQNYIVKFAKTESSVHHWELDCEAEEVLQ